MPCKVYPASPCPFDFTGQVTRKSCGACINFIPPRHILTGCALYDREGKLCLKPASACAGCSEHRSLAAGGQVREFDAEADERAKRNAEKRAALFKERHPDYHKKYYEANREKINARRRKQ